MFKKPFSFEGRIRRLEYGITWLCYFVFLIMLQFAAGAGASFLSILAIPFIWLMLAQGAKRCHDLGKSGFWQMIPFYFVALLFLPGSGELNEYGYPPLRSNEEKQMNIESEIQSIGRKQE